MNKITQTQNIPAAYNGCVFPNAKISTLSGINSGSDSYTVFECRMLVPVSRQGHIFLVSMYMTSRVPAVNGSYNSEREYEAQKKEMFIREILAEVENMQRYYVVDSNTFFDINGVPIVWELLPILN